jgi:type IV pilus assembly protein PilA
MLNRRKQQGFSLIELLIVVAIILVIAAIAIPNLLSAKNAAAQASAVGSLRTINSANATYAASYQGQGYAGTLNRLGGADPCTPAISSACMIDSILSGGTKEGYAFTYTGDGNTPSVGYTVTAVPINNNNTLNSYCTDQSGVIRTVPAAGACTAASTPIQ